MIAEDRIDAERRLQARELFGPRAGRDIAADEAMGADEIAEQHRQVRPLRIGQIDDGADALLRHPGIAGVDVGDDGDLEIEAGGPSRRGQRIGGQRELPARLEGRGVAGEAGGRREGAEAGQETATRNQHDRNAWVFDAPPRPGPISTRIARAQEARTTFRRSEIARAALDRFAQFGIEFLDGKFEFGGDGGEADVAVEPGKESAAARPWPR